MALDINLFNYDYTNDPYALHMTIDANGDTPLTLDGVIR